MIGRPRRLARARRIAERASEDLARAASWEDAARALVDGVCALLGRRDDAVVTRIDVHGRRFRVLAGSTPGLADVEGDIGAHPVLCVLPDLAATLTVHVDDPSVEPDLVARLRAADVRDLRYVPLSDPSGTLYASVIVLHRSRRAAKRNLDRVYAAGADAFARLHRVDEIERSERERSSASATIVLLADALRSVAGTSTIEEIIGIVLRSLRQLDEHLLGAVVGTVTDGWVGQVSAIGTTPRRAVESLSGTRLDGFPIGRQLISERRPHFAPSRQASLATRTRIMEPIGARSLLAAAGRHGDVVRVVASSYRNVEEPPHPWVLTAIGTLLDQAATHVERFEDLAFQRIIAESVGDGIVLLDSARRVTFASERARLLVPEIAPGERLDAGEAAVYVNRGGEDLPPESLPWAGSAEGPVRRTMRHATTGRLHDVRMKPIGTGAVVLVITDVTDTPDAEVADIAERRARKA